MRLRKGDVVVCIDATLADGWVEEAEVYEVTAEPQTDWTGQSLISVTSPALVLAGREESGLDVRRFEVIGSVR